MCPMRERCQEIIGRYLTTIVVTIAATAFSAPPACAVDERPQSVTAAATLRQVPLYFERNRGQSRASAEFVSRGHGYELALDPRGASLTLAGGGASRTLRLSFANERRARSLVADGLGRGTVSYFQG